MELIEPVLSRTGSPLALIGHSYGAAVAFVTALANPRRVHAMALYEPTLLSLIDAQTPAPNEAEGIRNAVADASVALDAGHQDAAAERFIDYWMGTGSWKQTPELRKSSIVASVINVRRWAHTHCSPSPHHCISEGCKPDDAAGVSSQSCDCLAGLAGQLEVFDIGSLACNRSSGAEKFVVMTGLHGVDRRRRVKRAGHDGAHDIRSLRNRTFIAAGPANVRKTASCHHSLANS
ncbi:thioesterase domain-containing protein [Paraburkholderia sp. 40]|uniref:thioesterase domain-containing protein n=1 Tax=Paraburkholderia sp. 40 TaxID=2991059 RepID=UPI003D199310